MQAKDAVLLTVNSPRIQRAVEDSKRFIAEAAANGLSSVQLEVTCDIHALAAALERDKFFVRVGQNGHLVVRWRPF